MKVKSLIAQSPSQSRFKEELTDLLDAYGSGNAILVSAFVTEHGANLIKPELVKLGNRATVISGISNPYTTLEGLKVILESGCNLYLIDTRSSDYIFHSKYYLGYKDDIARYIVGSGNLTQPGMEKNFETGIVCDIELSDTSDKQLFNEIISQTSDLKNSRLGFTISVSGMDELNYLAEQGLIRSRP